MNPLKVLNTTSNSLGLSGPLFETLLSDISRSLSGASISHMIIGGQAVLLYGEPRLTRDIDIVLGVDVDEVDRLLAAVGSLALSPLPKDVHTFATSTHVVPMLHDRSGIRVDFIFSFSVYEQRALQRVVKKEILGQMVPFASVEDIIIHKIVAGRPRDIEDVKGILARPQGIDTSYVVKWLEEFGRALSRNLVDDYKMASAGRR